LGRSSRRGVRMGIGTSINSGFCAVPMVLPCNGFNLGRYRGRENFKIF
jgi:hypothetical protein